MKRLIMSTISPRLSTVLLVLVTTLMAVAMSAQAVTFNDGDFVPSQWQSQTFLTYTSTATPSTVASGGNPDAYRSLYLFSSLGFLQPTGRSMIVETKTSAVVTPASVGGITQVDYNEDHYCMCLGGSVLWGPAVEQGGVYYIVPGNVMPNGMVVNWYNEGLTGLTASDFERVDVNSVTWTDPSQNPDFSAAGGPVTFGFVRAKAFSPYTNTVLDNWSVGVNESAVAVESKAWGAVKSSYR